MNHFYTVLISTQGKITGINTKIKTLEQPDPSSLTEPCFLGDSQAQLKKWFGLAILLNTYMNSTAGDFCSNNENGKPNLGLNTRGQMLFSVVLTASFLF